MKIALSGASGFLGTALVKILQQQGHRTVRLVRRPPQSGSDEVYWSPQTGIKPSLPAIDVLINLSGESIFAWWTLKKKRRIYQSRITATRLLVDSLKQMSVPPSLLINASAVGYYGDRGEAVIDETCSSGSDFLAKTCMDWEAAANSAKVVCDRVVCLRTGLVLDSDNGFLKQMLPFYKRGMGTRIGTGEQYMSWIHLQDWVSAVMYSIEQTLQGAINLVAPEAVTQAHLTHALAQALNRPAFLRLPAFAVRLFGGEMGKTVLLNSTRCIPEKLKRSGFTFHYHTIENALENCVQRATS